MKLKNGKSIEIRKAKKEDASELLDYLNMVGGESDNLTFGANEFRMTVEQEEQHIESVNNSPTSVHLVGIVDGKIICAGSIFASKKERLSHNCDLGISVIKEYWGLGAGTLLSNELISFAKNSKKLEIIHLKVNADNEHAISLYKNLGFEEIGRYPKEMKVNGRYIDTILMNLYLGK